MRSQLPFQLSPEAYGILDECKCGPEPFFVLVSSVDLEDAAAVVTFQETLLALVDAKLLSASNGAAPLASLSKGDLEGYVRERLNAGELLDEPPATREELSFETTEAGLMLLKPEDRPIATQKG